MKNEWDGIKHKESKHKSSKGIIWIGALAVIAIVCLILLLSWQDNKTPTGNTVIIPTKDGAQMQSSQAVNSTDLISKVLKLRDYSNAGDLVLTAERVSLINKEMQNQNIAEIKASWQNIVDCVFDRCSDTTYMSMIDAVSMLDSKNRKNAAIHSLIETCKLWNGKNQLYFSDSLSKTNRLLLEFNDKEINDKWQGLIQCRGQCENFSDLSVKLIFAINKA